MSSARYDRGVLQITDAKDLKELIQKINEKLRKASEQIAHLEGRSGELSIKNSMTLQTDGYTFLDLDSSKVGKASISAQTASEVRSIDIARGARRDGDSQWVATDSGAVILSLRSDGTMIMYANTNLTIGAAFTPTEALSFPTGSAQHGLVSITHTASGLTAGDILFATDTNAFGFGNVSTLTELAVTPDQDADYWLIYDGTAPAKNKKILPKYVSGNQPHSCVFSAGQYFTTGGANLTSYDYTFPANDLQVGDVVHIEGVAVLGGTTAGTKSLTLAFGTGTPTTVFSSTTTTNNTRFQFRLTAVVRSVTSIAVFGLTFFGVAAAAPTGYVASSAQTVSDISANTQLVRMVGTHTGANNELRMIDYNIIVFRAGGNVTTV